MLRPKNGSEIFDVEVDYQNLHNSVLLPDTLGEVVVLTVSAATPELPSAAAVVFVSE